jgi:hypothetical protein
VPRQEAEWTRAMQILCFLRPISFRVKIAELYHVLGQRRADGVVGSGGDRDADHATAATFRYFVGFHSRAISRAWAS